MHTLHRQAPSQWSLSFFPPKCETPKVITDFMQIVKKSTQASFLLP